MSQDANEGHAGRLTPDEDAALRRWQYFHTLGFTLSQPVDQLRASIRARDKRIEIRESRDVIEPTSDGCPPRTNRAGRLLH